MANLFACICCREPISAENVSIAGVDICRACLVPRNIPPQMFTYQRYPPLWWGAILGSLFIGAILIGFLTGHFIALGLSSLGFEYAWPAKPLGAAAGLLVFAFWLRTFTWWLQEIWKRQIIREYGMTHLPPERLKLAVLLHEPKYPCPDDLKLLIETPDSLLFIGSDWRQTVIPLSDISELGSQGFAGARWLVLAKGNKPFLWLLIQEDGEMAWGRYAATMALGARIEKRIRPDVTD